MCRLYVIIIISLFECTAGQSLSPSVYTYLYLPSFTIHAGASFCLEKLGGQSASYNTVNPVEASGVQDPMVAGGAFNVYMQA